jgi:hypothetical protein
VIYGREIHYLILGFNKSAFLPFGHCKKVDEEIKECGLLTAGIYGLCT